MMRTTPALPPTATFPVVVLAIRKSDPAIGGWMVGHSLLP